jgi:hypothetical protein
VTEERRVEPGKIAQNRLKFCRVDIVAVEPFLFMAALFEIEALSGRLGHRIGRGSSQARGYGANAHDCWLLDISDSSEFQVSF